MPDRRRALVTGGSRGIGRAVVLELAAQGIDVVAAARTVAADPFDCGNPASGKVYSVTVDLQRSESVQHLPVLATETLGGPVDIFVHCAGIAPSGRFTQVSLEEWNEVMFVNATSATLLAQQLAPAMVNAGWGRIVTIGSLYSRMGGRFALAYTASKHALLGATRVIALELARSGVTANQVAPGWTDTDMVRQEAKSVALTLGLSEGEAVQRFLQNQPIARLIEPAEVAGVVGFLCSDAARSITGQAINIDGGSYQA